MFPAIGRLCEKCDGKWLVDSVCFGWDNAISKARYYLSCIVQYATPMCDRKPSFGSVMNVTLEHTAVAVLSVDRLVRQDALHTFVVP